MRPNGTKWRASRINMILHPKKVEYIETHSSENKENKGKSAMEYTRGTLSNMRFPAGGAAASEETREARKEKEQEGIATEAIDLILHEEKNNDEAFQKTLPGSTRMFRNVVKERVPLRQRQLHEWKVGLLSNLLFIEF